MGWIFVFPVFRCLIMDQTGRTERYPILDLECGGTNNPDEDSKLTFSGSEQSKHTLERYWSGVVGLDDSVKGVDTTISCNHATSASDIYPGNAEVSIVKIVVEDKARVKGQGLDSGKPRKPKCKKPPKPPRPPKGPLLNAADQKLVQQISELAMMKRANIEKMKALKKMKANKPPSSGGSICAMLITIGFCLVVLLQGVFSQNNSTVRFQGSPVSAMAATPDFISIQFNSNNSMDVASAASSASPGIIQQTSDASLGERS